MTTKKEQDGTVSVFPTTFNFTDWTNANKVQIIAFVNAALALAIGFGLHVSDVQFGLIIAFANAAMALFGARTAQMSPVAEALRRHIARRKAGEA